MKYDSFSGTDVGKKRGANEDTYGDQKTINGHVFVVCDGMGGHVGGARASGMAVSSILEYFAREPIENIIIGIDKAISFANEQIYATALNEPEYKGMGTTVTVSVIKDAEVFIGHVGDSRIYLKSNGKLNRITKDHSKVQELLDRNLITNTQAENHKEKNIILKALGIKPEVEATVCPVSLKLTKGDVLLMCSDGLSDLVNDKQMEAMINCDDLKGSVSSLIDKANNNGGPDNITATLIAIAESVHPVSVFQEFNPVITQEVGKENAEPTVDLTSSEQGGDRNWKMIILSGIGGIITLVFLVYLFFPSEEVSDNKSGQEVPIDETVKDTIPEREPEREAEPVPAPESGGLGLDTPEGSAEAALEDNQETQDSIDTKTTDTPAILEFEVHISTEKDSSVNTNVSSPSNENSGTQDTINSNKPALDKVPAAEAVPEEVPSEDSEQSTQTDKTSTVAPKSGEQNEDKKPGRKKKEGKNKGDGENGSNN